MGRALEPVRRNVILIDTSACVEFLRDTGSVISAGRRRVGRRHRDLRCDPYGYSQAHETRATLKRIEYCTLRWRGRALPVELSGRVVVTGSEPNVMLVIVTDDTHYELVGELAEELRKLQQRQVTVRGRIVRQALGPGSPAWLAVDGYAN